ncbi:alpha/beta-hydrolase [Penicillium herquei]|nr:alpha/beta-hydrolase [Penicillium herquei]
MMLPEESVAFQTLDGLTLRGTLYPALGKGPGIIMTPGFNCLSGMLGLPDVAASFQQSNYTVLLYDPRNTGQSEGQPRNDIDPVRQVSDYSDAVSFLSMHPSVFSSEIYIWGMSFSASVALCTAAVDKRISGVIAVAPLTDFTLKSDKLPNVLARSMQDRVSQIAGNQPYYVPFVTSEGKNPAGFGSGVDREQYQLLLESGKKNNFIHDNRTTIQSYYKMVMWQPFGLWDMIGSIPALFIVPEMDQMSPAEHQKRIFDRIAEPKRLFIQEGVGHMEIMEGDHVPQLMKVMTEFLGKAASGSA